jgi:integrase
MDGLMDATKAASPAKPAPRRPRSMRRPLTPLDVRNRPPGLHQDAEVAGLYLRVTDTGARGFLLRFMLAGRRRDMWLGTTSELTLAQARDAAREQRRRIKDGVDPVEERIAERARARHERALADWTFERAARALHAELLPGWRNPKHGDQWINTLGAYVFPAFGDKPVGAVDAAVVRAVLLPIWTTKAETARRVRQRLDAVMRWAVAHGYATTNPVDAAIVLLPKQSDQVEHHDALPVADAPVFMVKLRAGNAAASRRALEFLVLTAARSGEVRGATWGEVDLDAATWTVPAERMKARRLHVVPLAEPALALLRAIKAEQGEPAADALIFPAPRGGVMSDNVFKALFDRMKVDGVTAHGFRSTFRDWCGENGVPREVAERALAHTVKDATEAAYLRTTLLAQRAEVMARWAAFLAGGAE